MTSKCNMEILQRHEESFHRALSRNVPGETLSRLLQSCSRTEILVPGLRARSHTVMIGRCWLCNNGVSMIGLF